VDAGTRTAAGRLDDRDRACAALVGASNVATEPSPVVLTSARRSGQLRARSHRARRSRRQAASPNSAACRVESTRSVKAPIVSTRSADPCRCPVRNSSTSSSTASGRRRP
jgi:hypothetical protein